MKALRVKAQAIPVATPTFSVLAASQVAWVTRAAEQLGRPDAVDARRLGRQGLLGELVGGVADRGYLDSLGR